MFRPALVTVFTALVAFAQAPERSASISDLVRVNPGAALRQLASEEPEVFQGTLSSVTLADSASGRLETLATLQIGDVSYPVITEEPMQPGCSVAASVRGYRIGDQILAASIQSSGPLSSPACTSIGVQKTLVILVNTPSVTMAPTIDSTYVQNFMMGATPPTVNGYFQEVSGGRTSVSSDTVGPFTLSAEPGCVTTDALVRNALNLADPSTDLTLYSRILVIAPRGVSGTPTLCATRVYSNGCRPLVTAASGTITASWAYAASELLSTAPVGDGIGVSLGAKALGNGMGIGWSYTRDYGTAALGAFGPGGTDKLEGDQSVMGDFHTYGASPGVYPLGHVSSRQKFNFGWYFVGTEIENVQSNLTRTILPAASPTSGLKALRIRRGTGYNEWLWVEYRRFLGSYESTVQNWAPTLESGVLIYHERPGDDPNSSFLLNFKPVAAPNNFATAMLLPGAVWNDPSSNLSLQVAASGSNMQVTTTYRPTGGCAYTPVPSTIGVSSAAGTTGFNVTTGTYCEWLVSTGSPFVSITSPTFNTGPGAVALSYLANGTGVARSASIDIAGLATATLNQSNTGAAGNLQISGRVTLSGNPLAGVNLSLSGSAVQTATTNGSGNYVLGGLASGTYTVTPKLAGYGFTPPSVTFNGMGASQVSNFTAAVLPALLSVDRARLNFAGTNTTWFTPSQKVVVSFGGGSAAWTASVNQAWLTVTPASGTGATRVTVSINPALLPPSGTAVGAVTFSAPTATPTAASTAVYLTRVVAPTAPNGAFDTPVNNATNLAGSFAVTGWAIDDIYVSQVRIYRDKIGNEPVQPNGLIYIGDAVFVANARSDIEGQNSTLPYNYRGGWGYLMLSNAIPNASGPQGNGTIKLWAIATDIEGKNTTLGSKVITLNNAASKLPFGAIDAPGQGASAVGVVSNSGWVMTPQPNIMVASPVNITVYVDGAAVGKVSYGQARPDVAGLFPSYRNSSGPGANFSLDTALLSNAMHSIFWIAYDDAGNGDGIGSRFFFVENGLSAGIANPAPPAASGLEPVTETRAARPRPQRMAVPQVRTAQELDRLVIDLPEGEWTGAHVINGGLQPLPVGSTLDNTNGAFYWHLGPGFLGTHELLFTSADGAVYGVTVNIEPKSFGEKQ